MYNNAQMEQGPQNKSNPRAEARLWLATTLGCSAVGGFAFGNAINLAEYGVPAEDPGLTLGPVIGLVFTGLAIAAFDKFHQERAKVR